jgi:hypothetical protein
LGDIGSPNWPKDKCPTHPTPPPSSPLLFLFLGPCIFIQVFGALTHYLWPKAYYFFGKRRNGTRDGTPFDKICNVYARFLLAFRVAKFPHPLNGCCWDDITSKTLWHYYGVRVGFSPLLLSIWLSQVPLQGSLEVTHPNSFHH